MVFVLQGLERVEAGYISGQGMFLPIGPIPRKQSYVSLVESIRSE